MARVLVTGGAGFIGSHIVDALVGRGDEVVVVDDLSTGFAANLSHLEGRIEFRRHDIRDLDSMLCATKGVDLVTHQAALGSVPRSIKDPVTSNAVNVDGTLNVLHACEQNGVKRVVVASSSSVYGDTHVSPKHEGLPLNPKSPYALTKATGEEYARIFSSVYGLQTIALRYFNVFGPRQSPSGAYAAVVPRFIDALRGGRQPTINGDGSHSRDFTYVANAVQANLCAFDAPDAACGAAYNIGAGGEITILQLFEEVRKAVGVAIQPSHGPVRAGDVEHSKADISKARQALGYAPFISFEQGIRLTVEATKGCG